MNDAPTQALLDRYQAGDPGAIDELLCVHRDRLKRMVQVRLNPQVRGRVDESDILQEALLEASEKINDYFLRPPMPFFLWLRWITEQRLHSCHRFHLDAQKRSAKRDKPLIKNDRSSLSVLIADQIAHSTPSQIAMKAELIEVVMQLLGELKPTDREVLSMRHFEQLTNGEVAIALDLDPSSASSRYVRALEKLQSHLARKLPGIFADGDSVL